MQIPENKVAVIKGVWFYKGLEEETLVVKFLSKAIQKIIKPQPAAGFPQHVVKNWEVYVCRST